MQGFPVCAKKKQEDGQRILLYTLFIIVWGYQVKRYTVSLFQR